MYKLANIIGLTKAIYGNIVKLATITAANKAALCNYVKPGDDLCKHVDAAATRLHNKYKLGI